MHTTASDGTSTPEDLVARVRRAGITTFSVTDHDTMAAVPVAAAAAAREGLTCVPGIEITTVHDGHDVHMLGYWLDADSAVLGALLQRIRALRVERAAEISSRLAAAGVPIDVESLLQTADPGSSRSLARPQIARALIAAGHVATVSEAFDRFLSEGCCAYVAHRGPSPAEGIAVIREAGGIASLAHPGTNNRDDLVPALVEAGLTAIEAYHSAHDAGRRRAIPRARRHARPRGQRRLGLSRRRRAPQRVLRSRRSAGRRLRAARGSARVSVRLQPDPRSA